MFNNRQIIRVHLIFPCKTIPNVITFTMTIIDLDCEVEVELFWIPFRWDFI